MGRRIASQVHQQVSRLLRANYLKKEPAWFQAVLDNPPLVLPPKAAPVRTAYDKKPTRKDKKYSARPVSIYYVEDDVRRQFFADHPFEAFRPTTLIEADVVGPSNPVTGPEWTRLRQRGRNPRPEDAVQFALNLYQHHGMTLSEAYAKAVAQFRALRSEHHIATTFAVMEAKALGSTFEASYVEKAHEMFKKSLSTWERQAELDEGALAARKRWKAIVDKNHGADQWTKGEEYVRLWRANVRPDFMPALQEPIEPAPTTPARR